MGKKSKKRKRFGSTTLADPAPGHGFDGPTAAKSTSVVGDELGGILRDELDITIETLRFLADKPQLFGARAFRELRAALHPLVMLQMRKYDPVDYTERVRAALQGGRWHDALQALDGLRASGAPAPKQGTVQRWVRAADAAPELIRMQLLHAILRAQQPHASSAATTQGASSPKNQNKHDPAEAISALAKIQAAGGGGANDGSIGTDSVKSDAAPRQWMPIASELPAGESCGEGGLRDGPTEMAPHFNMPPNSRTMDDEKLREDHQQDEGWHVRWLPTWTAPRPATSSASPTEAVDETGSTAREDGKQPADLGIRVVYSEDACERRPPNHHDLRLYSCEPSSVCFDADGGTATARHDIPGVPGAFMLTGLLSRRECALLVNVAESMGFSPDHPVGQPEPTGIDACEWLVSDALQATIFRRAAPFAPIIRGCAACGLNARWRFFRYDKGARYRPHIDGSWVGPGLDASGKYVHDFRGDRRSRLTFLMYLNEGFQGGNTTFYLPSPDGNGQLEAHGVQPMCGAVLCFPQGNTASLVHEGSTVKGGRKYVIRTDMLFLNDPERPNPDANATSATSK